MAMHRCALVLAGSVSLVVAERGVAQDDDSPVYPPHSVVHGFSLGWWGAHWWEWAAAMCEGNHAVYDEAGELAHVGQGGSPVFFLAGTFSNCGRLVTRTCKVPADTELFFPLLNTPCTNYPPLDFPPEDLAATCRSQMDKNPVMKLEVDGEEVLDLLNHREPYQGFFMYESACNPWMDPPGSHYSVHDGFYVMLKPLAPGPHTIYLKGTLGNPDLPDFCAEVLYNLTVEEMPTPEDAFRRGDSDASGKVDITDAVFTLDWLFRGGPEPPCIDAADFQDDGGTNITDAVGTVTWLFSSGVPPVWPGPDFCGRDTTEDTLARCGGGCRG